VTALGDVARQACERAGVRPADLAAFVPHQANGRIIDSLARDLGITGAVARDVVDTANTSAASIPLALTRLRESGDVATGDAALLLGFGSGLTWAGQVVTVP
jgi:3-oxoacyl-[acyl-carrier-protein] synthase-3